MALFAEVNGTPVKKAEIIVPWYGVWTADVQLDRVTGIANPVTLTVGGLVMKGVIFRAGDFVGTTSYRLVGGANGWGKIQTELFYRNPFGIKVSLIAKDAASTIGESIAIDASAERELGGMWTRRAEPGSRVLDRICDLWWVRPDGVTQIGTHSTTLITSKYDVIPEGTNLAVGKITIATDAPQDWAPGRTFKAPQFASTKTISSAIHRLDSGKLRTEVWTA